MWNDPITREEEWLGAIQGMEGVAAPAMPVWHYEQMLAALYDVVSGAENPREFPERSWHLDELIYGVYCLAAGLDDPGIPAPTCRIEEYWRGVYMAVKGEADASVPDPVWRIEEWLKGIFDVAAEWGGFETTVSGTAPLTLANAIAKAMLGLTQYGKVEQRNIPAPYTELEYIDNNGTAWLDLGMPIGSADIVTFDIKWNDAVSAPFFGAYNAGGGFANQSFVGTISTAGAACFYANSSSVTGRITKPTARATYKWNGISAMPTLDGRDAGTVVPPYADFTPSVNAYLFTRNEGGTAGSVDDITLYGFKVERNGAVIINLIPAKRDSDNVVGMYDTVRGQFLTSAGIGSFTAGPAITPSPVTPMDIWCNNGKLKARHQSGLPVGYQRLEYLEATGTQYLDTGFYFDNPATDTLTVDLIKTIGGGGTVFYGFRDRYKVNGYGMQFSDAGATNIQWADKDTGLGTNPAMQIGTRYTAVRTGPSYSIGGSSYTIADAGSVTQNYPLYLFCTNDGGSPNLRASAKIYEVTVVNAQGVTRMHLLPAKRLSDNELGMYDLVSGSFFTNAGTGSFTAGTAASDPIEVYADAQVGKNLFNKAAVDAGWVVGKILNDNGVETNDNQSCYSTYFIPVKSSTDYYVSWADSGMYGAIQRIYYYDANKQFLSRSTSLSSPTYKTTPANCVYIRVQRQNQSYADATDFQIEEGQVRTSFEPFHEGELLTVRGTNLVDLDAVTNEYYYTQSGTYSALADCRLTDYIPVKAGEKYTVWAQAETLTTYANVRANLFDSSQIWLSQTIVALNSTAQPKVLVMTPTVDGYLRVSANYRGDNHVDWSTLRVAQGEYTLETMPSYEPYVTPQTITDIPDLLAYDSIFDEVDLVPGTTKRRIAACLYDGTQTIGDRYMSTTGGKDVGAIILYPRETEYDGDVAVYVPDTLYEQTTPQALVLHGGTNIVSVDANVDDVYLEARYKAVASLLSRSMGSLRKSGELLRGSTFRLGETSRDILERFGLEDEIRRPGISIGLEGGDIRGTR